MIKKVNLNKKRSGLMLYEIVISIFVMVIFSGFIMQFFLYANILNSKASDIDNSTIILTNAMELSKNFPSLSQYYKDEFFDGASIDTSTNGKEITLYKYYDNNWSTIYDDQDINNLNNQTKYILYIEIDEVLDNTKTAVLSFVQNDLDATTYGNSSGLKYKLSGKICYADNLNEPIIQLQTTSYFSNNIK